MKFILILIIFTALFSKSVFAGGNNVKANLNGLEIEFEKYSGSIVSLSYNGVGHMLDTEVQEASVLDMAYPITKFEPLRLASRFSKNAKIDITDKLVTITWDKMGASRDFELEGYVKAVVRMEALEDGKSILMTCEIENNSPVPIKQVIFPDFMGVLPFCGESDTWMKTCVAGNLPFLELKPNEFTRSQQFMSEAAAYTREYTSGGKFSNMMMRWFDFGGLKGGFSLFQKRWGWDPRTTVRLTHSETESKMRVSNIDLIDINPNEVWESPEYVFTPHTGGWAKGIEPFIEYAHSRANRQYPLPKHVKESIGFRSIWMSLGWPEDPKDVRWTFKDMDEIAKDTAEHGLSEINVWGWHKFFSLPLPDPLPHLGTLNDFASARKMSKEKYGVEITPFISIIILAGETLDRYGIPRPQGNGNNWTQHTETIPRFQPAYSSLYKGDQVGPNNDKWKEEALEGMKRYVDAGLASISWDQYFNISSDGNNMIELSEKIRAYQKTVDPEATWSGEEVFNMEISLDWLDYTWNWGSYQDVQAFNSVFKYPRLNVNITDSGLDTKRCFLDNIYINAFPRRANDVNGSAFISEAVDVSKALKVCSKIKQNFLDYFTEGRFIGDCICYETPSGVKVSAYILGKKALVMVLNTQGIEQVNSISCDFGNWLGDFKNYIVKNYDEDCNLIKTTVLKDQKNVLSTKILKPEEISIFEISAK